MNFSELSYNSDLQIINISNQQVGKIAIFGELLAHTEKKFTKNRPNFTKIEIALNRIISGLTQLLEISQNSF